MQKVKEKQDSKSNVHISFDKLSNVQILTVLDFKRCWEQIGWDRKKAEEERHLNRFTQEIIYDMVTSEQLPLFHRTICVLTDDSRFHCGEKSPCFRRCYRAQRRRDDTSFSPRDEPSLFFLRLFLQGFVEVFFCYAQWFTARL